VGKGGGGKKRGKREEKGEGNETVRKGEGRGTKVPGRKGQEEKKGER